MWVLVQTASARRLLRRFERVPTINDLRRNKKGIKIFPLKILFGKMQCIWIDMFSLWGKSGVCWGVHYFLISALKYRLWVLVRTDTSLRRFEFVPIGQTWGIQPNTSQIWSVWPNSTKLSHIQQNTSHAKNPTEFLTPISPKMFSFIKNLFTCVQAIEILMCDKLVWVKNSKSAKRILHLCPNVKNSVEFITLAWGIRSVRNTVQQCSLLASGRSWVGDPLG